MQMPGNSRDRSNAEVKTVQGIPMVVYVSQPQLDSDLEEDSDLICIEGKNRTVAAEPSTSISRDSPDSETRQLIHRCLNDFTGLVKPTWDESKALSTMKRVVADLLEKYRCKYNGGY